MKIKMIFYFLIVVPIAISALLFTQSCQKAVGPIESPTSAETYKMKGMVIDVKTNVGIPNAEIKVFDKIVVSDVNGYFTFEISNATKFPFTIYAQAANYVYGTSLITGPSQVRAIKLMPLNPGVTIDANGGKVLAHSNESVSGDSIRLIIPAGALSQAVSISVTPMENFFPSPGGVKSNLKETISNLNLLTLSIDPQGLVFNFPVQLFCPLPFYNDKNSEFPLYLYNSTINQWVNTGKKLKIDESISGGFVDITQTGIYSIGGEGTYNEYITSQSLLFKFSCNGDTNIVWQALVDYLQGYPDSVSQTWLKNTVSAHSILGGQVSFFNTTLSSIVCEPIQPAPLPPPVNPADTNEIIIPYPPTCASGAHPVLIDNGKTWEKRIINGLLTFIRFRNGAISIAVGDKETVQVPVHRYSWNCVHDQGGGK